MKIAIFPSGLSSLNTLQCSLSFLNEGENWICWIISTPETRSVCERFEEYNPKIKAIFHDDLAEELEKANGDIEFNFLIGPSTREEQLRTLSLLFNHSYIPTFWFIEESPDQKNDKRFLSSYTGAKIPMSILEKTVVKSVLLADDLSFIQANRIIWDVHSNRFIYNVQFPRDAVEFSLKRIRGFQDKAVGILQEAQKRFGKHAVDGRHPPLGEFGWHQNAHDRFQQAGFRGGR
tara:strand:- start:1222 stop:1920 length:699 start_codon:yes stop_codon:yes gene_type:complete